jgi:PleD family two-component response regulator
MSSLFYKGEVKGVSASFGIKSYVTAPISIDEMVRAADEFMYSAKRSAGIHESESDQQKENKLVRI